MLKAAGLLLAAVFAALCLLHVYWAAGGRFGGGVGVPTVGGRRAFEPTPAATVLVAVALFAAMLVVLGRIDVWGGFVPRPLFRWGTWGISLIFFLRSVGDFKLFGFFKEVRGTRFAQYDTWLYSPLCLVIALVAFVLAYRKV